MPSTANTIVARGNGEYFEGTAGETLRPGDIVDISANKWYRIDESSDGAYDAAIWALVVENGLEGGTVDDTYAADERVFLYLPMNGDILNVQAQDDIAIGEPVCLAVAITAAGSDGCVKQATTTAQFKIGFSREALTGHSDSPTAISDNLVQIRVARV